MYFGVLVFLSSCQRIHVFRKMGTHCHEVHAFRIFLEDIILSDLNA